MNLKSTYTAAYRILTQETVLYKNINNLLCMISFEKSNLTQTDWTFYRK